jgi:hypothetical protein
MSGHAAWCLACLMACAVPRQEAPVAAPAAAEVATAADGPPKPYASAEALLEALEGSTRNLRDFQATVVYDRLDAITEDRERRIGRIVLEQDSSDPPRRRFAIAFEQFIDAAGHASPQPQRFAFADGWLVEFDDARKQSIERQLSEPGARSDPLRLGEGPMPLPVGQRAEEVRRRYTVSPAPAPDAALLKRLEGVQGLVLVPKPGTGQDEDFEEVRIWYDLRTLAPVGVVARLKGGDVKTVLLREVVVNGGLDESARASLSISVPADWRRDVRPLRVTVP